MRLIFLSCSLLLLSWISPPDYVNSEKAKSIISKSQSFHDPTDAWSNALINFHIEEPRVQNPTRYSEIFLNMSDGTFTLVRNREDHLTTYSIDANGKPMVLLDGTEQMDDELRARYRLYPDRVGEYRTFYQVMYGMPMSINSADVRRYGEVTTETFENQEVLAIPIYWKETLLKPVWTIFIDPTTFAVAGVELSDPENPANGERIVFQGMIDHGGIRIPHMRHWYNLKSNSYLGSDIILSMDKL